MQKILITGGTGMVGASLTQYLINKGFGIHIFSRSTAGKTNTATVQYFTWNPAAKTYDVNALQNVVAIINLAGEGIAAKRWTNKRKEAILQSRVEAGNTIATMLTKENHTIDTLIQASATGWYNAVRDVTYQLQENEPANTDYLGATCKAWEDSVSVVENSTVRVVTIRIGIVLNKKGGMVKELLKPMSFGILPIFGNGNQLVPWVHQQDLCKIFYTAIQNKEWRGAYNAVATNNTTQKELAKQIAKTMDKKIWLSIPIPSFALKIGLGEMSIELLKSVAIENDKIKKAGFPFEYPALESISDL